MLSSFAVGIFGTPETSPWAEGVWIGSDCWVCACSIGMGTTVFGVYSKDGYTWRYISNTKIESLKLEKIVDKDLHADSAHEKAMKLQKILEGKDGD